MKFINVIYCLLALAVVKNLADCNLSRVELTSINAEEFYNSTNREFVLNTYLGDVRNSSDISDVRLIPILWLQAIYKMLRDGGGVGKSGVEFSLPFSWKSWLGLSQVSVRGIENCTTIACDESYSELDRIRIGHNYLTSNILQPDRVIFLQSELKAVIVPVSKSTKEDDIYTPAMECELESKEFVSISEETIKLNELVLEGVTFVDDAKLYRDILRFKERINHLNETILRKDDFILNVDNILEVSTSNIQKCNQFQLENEFDKRVAQALNNNAGSTKENGCQKYFHEANLINSGAGSHYDWRFFQGNTYSTYERQAILHRLVRTWFKLNQLLGLKSWLSHGSLLGWYWNGLSLPWDEDLDLQITIDSLYRLSRNYNQSIIVDISPDEGPYNMGMGQYFLDIGSRIFQREESKGDNVIDARFIDIRSGIYIDITSLTFTLAAKELILKDENNEKEFKQVLKSNHIAEDGEEITSYEEFCDARALLWNKENLYNCKNNHFYTIEELAPLIPVTFEGIKAYVPQEFERLLERSTGNHTNQKILEIGNLMVKYGYIIR